MRAGWVVAVCLCACVYDPRFDRGTTLCAREEPRCPPGLVCLDDHCRSPDAGPAADPLPDTRPADAPPREDAPVDAPADAAPAPDVACAPVPGCPGGGGSFCTDAGDLFTCAGAGRCLDAGAIHCPEFQACVEQDGSAACRCVPKPECHGDQVGGFCMDGGVFTQCHRRDPSGCVTSDFQANCPVGKVCVESAVDGGGCYPPRD